MGEKDAGKVGDGFLPGLAHVCSSSQSSSRMRRCAVAVRTTPRDGQLQLDRAVRGLKVRRATAPTTKFTTHASI